MKIRIIAASIALAASLPGAALATNGMLLEGYGPIALGMGGAAIAYDNGSAATMNNPATIGLMAKNTGRLDVALGSLGPDVDSQSTGSSGTAYYMPAFGYVRKGENFAMGIGVFAQGGMGTEYNNSGFYGGLKNFIAAGGTAAVTDPGLKNRSEVGVGRVSVPFAYDATENLTLGGSIDYVWAGMDIQWLVDGAHFGNLMPGQTNVFGKASGSMVTGFQNAMGAGNITHIQWGYFDFSNSNKMSGKAWATGNAVKLGATYKVDKSLTVGATFHSKTMLDDMTTDGNLSFNVSGAAFCGAGAPTTCTIPVTGKYWVKDFQFPSMLGLGLSFAPNDKLMLAADYKRIGWKSAMENFNITFIASAGQANAGAAGFANTQLDVVYYQRWKDQDVLALGASYKISDPLTVRAGLNISNNPVPDAYVSPLFPAIVTNHVTLGAGYKVSQAGDIDFALSHAPKVSVTNNWGTIGASSNQTISHSQTSWQLMYSHKF